MAKNRIPRLNEQFKREISEILRREVRDPRVGAPPTVAAVEVSHDLWSARVYVRVLGDEATQRQALEGLQSAAPFIRRELGRALHIRRIPELRFQLDRSLEHARRIEELLTQVLPERGGGEREGGRDS
ncbi:MAG: 30S ribosome-binding factor RbfA [Gemmatimonadetes bacterium]|nr:30S ribosome-binding factor RbfA [Gemmatimonadota bacterium]